MKRIAIIGFVVIVLALVNGCTDVTYQEASLLTNGMLGGEFVTVADTEQGESTERPKGVFKPNKVKPLYERYMDNLDVIQIYKGLESTPADIPVEWLNPNTGGRYTFVAGFTVYQVNNLPCRAYSMVGNVESIPVRLHGIACRDNKGNWLDMSTHTDPKNDNKN